MVPLLSSSYYSPSQLSFEAKPSLEQICLRFSLDRNTMSKHDLFMSNVSSIKFSSRVN